MVPRITRRKQFELSLDVKDADFIRPPDPSQQNWTISRAMDELAADLIHLDSVTRRFVDGSKRKQIVED